MLSDSKGIVMKWYAWRCWRLANAPRKVGYAEITDRAGRWKRVFAGLFVLVERRRVGGEVVR